MKKQGYKIVQDDKMARTLQRYAREQMKLRLYKDILADLAVCEIEGYDKKEYIDELIQMVRELEKN